MVNGMHLQEKRGGWGAAALQELSMELGIVDRVMQDRKGNSTLLGIKPFQPKRTAEVETR